SRRRHTRSLCDWSADVCSSDLANTMPDQEIENKVKQIIVDELGVDENEVTPNARVIDVLGADSLDTVELVMRFEEEFGIEIPDEDAEKIQSVRDAYNYIDQHKKWCGVSACAVIF